MEHPSMASQDRLLTLHSSGARKCLQVRWFIVFPHFGVQVRECPQLPGRSYSTLRRCIWAHECPHGHRFPSGARLSACPPCRSFYALQCFVRVYDGLHPSGHSLNALRRTGARMSASPPCRSFTACILYGRATVRSSPRRAHVRKTAL